MRISFEKVPLDVRRSAAQRLESIRGTDLGRRAEAARLSRDVCPIYRPDLDEVAYYEFELIVGAAPVKLVTREAMSSRVFERRAAKERATAEPARPARGTGHGFIVASAGPHDFPIPHWSLESPPPSRLLERLAEGDGKEITRVVKLDALAYVGEDADGERVATLGDLPKLVTGLPRDLRKRSPGISSLIARPPGDVTDDAPEGEHRIERLGGGAPELKPVEVEGWQEFKDRYADSFGPFLAQLEQQAQEAWEIDRLVREFGEGIIVGESHRVPLLHEEAKIEVGGEAASSVSVRMIERSGAPPVVAIHANSLPEDPKADLELRISYANQEEERLSFFVVSRDVPSTARGTRPPRTEERL
jgi:hypothetical protein